MTREQVEDWIRRYEGAWRSPGTEALKELFTEDATYRLSPYQEPEAGLAAIGVMWERERAVDGDRAVASVEVRYADPARPEEFRDIWLMRFEGSRCAHFEEWAYWPEKPYTAPRS
jgi:hypothetical protein